MCDRHKRENDDALSLWLFTPFKDCSVYVYITYIILYLLIYFYDCKVIITIRQVVFIVTREFRKYF